jgi:hypothetical protein
MRFAAIGRKPRRNKAAGGLSNAKMLWHTTATVLTWGRKE